MNSDTFSDIFEKWSAYVGSYPAVSDRELMGDFAYRVQMQARALAIALRTDAEMMQSVQSPPSPPRKCSGDVRGLERVAGRACGSIAVATDLRPALPDPTGSADVGNGSDMVATPEGAD